MKGFLLKFHLKLFDEFSEKLDYMSTLTVKFFFVNEKNRKLKLSFAKLMTNNPETYWNNVVFAHENKFNIFGSDGRITAWRKKKMRYFILRI